MTAADFLHAPAEFLFGPFGEFAFMKRALVGSLALCLGAVPVGVFLMLRRMSLIGDTMAHAILPGVAVGYLMSGLSLTAMSIGGLATGLAVALLAGLVTRTTVIREDASFAAFHLIALSIGVVIVSVRGSNIDLLHVLFGTVLALDNGAVAFLASVATVTMAALALLYRPLVIECIDPIFLRTVSRAGGLAHIGFLMLLVLNMVAGFHALGTLLAIGIMILPAVGARFWAHDITGLLLAALMIGALSCWLGLLASFHLDLPSGPAIVLVAGGLYLASMLLGANGGLAWRLLPARHLEA
ncbi:MAG: metal ABC transporter permease [Rhodobiaceae bacterium]|nr:metal ABC transporter permease [Rhodobiaceae bacterium]